MPHQRLERCPNGSRHHSKKENCSYITKTQLSFAYAGFECHHRCHSCNLVPLRGRPAPIGVATVYTYFHTTRYICIHSPICVTHHDPAATVECTSTSVYAAAAVLKSIAQFKCGTIQSVSRKQGVAFDVSGCTEQRSFMLSTQDTQAVTL